MALEKRVIAIRADFPELEEIIKRIEAGEKGDLPYTQEAVKAGTELVQRTWINYISGHRVTYSGGSFIVRVVTGDYLRSVIQGVSYPALGDKLTGEVTSLSPHGRIVEEGVKPFDMKQTHLSGPKVKVSKDGSKYITVPFRHQVPGQTALADAMPRQVYEQAKRMAISRRNNILRKFFTGRSYSWGDRLPREYGGEKEKPHWTTGRYTGMVKMTGRPHTSYLTFRRLSEKSKPEAWQHPGVDPRPVTQAVVENTQEEIIDLIRTGFEVDLVNLGF